MEELSGVIGYEEGGRGGVHAHSGHVTLLTPQCIHQLGKSPKHSF